VILDCPKCWQHACVCPDGHGWRNHSLEHLRDIRRAIDAAMAGALPSRRVFVFGSNLAGLHGKGAALEAREKWGAEVGIGTGPTGRAYALPTKDAQMRPLPLAAIDVHVRGFIVYAKSHPELRFYVTRVGCGLAGYTEAEIQPLFAGAPANCEFTWETEPGGGAERR
jgi:hypothetical protein